MGKCHYPTIGNEDLRAVESAARAGWFTHGKRCDEFERKVSEWIGTKYGSFVSSGSSASLLATASLTSWKLGPRRLKRGDEVITSALAFPTTVAPIVQNGLIPVFVDVEYPACNTTLDLIKRAWSPKVKAVVLANTLGNPIDPEIRAFCDKNDLWLIEDNCDGFGGTISSKKTGTTGHLSTLSFYPAHHITTGEGGMVLTDDPMLHEIVNSLRAWGRDCACQGGQDGICGKRFTGQHGLMPEGYDHKYIFSHFGYNLKNTELAAALGLAQLKRINNFISARRSNWHHYHERLQSYKDIYEGMEATTDSDPSWFGYLVVCQTGEKRKQAVAHLEKNGIQTRMLFAGNILRQPCATNGDFWYKISGNLNTTDILTNNAFWLGVAPSVTKEQIDKTCDLLISLVSQ